MDALFVYFIRLWFSFSGVFVMMGLLGEGVNRLFCRAAGMREGRRFALLSFALYTPLRELGHLVAAVIFGHRVGDYCLLNLYDPKGELGFVEHSYRPHSLIANLGNYFFALMPLLFSLFSVFLLLCGFFRGEAGELLSSVRTHSVSGAGILAYAREALTLLGSLLRFRLSDFFRRSLGLLLLLLLSPGVYLSFAELKDALCGFSIFLFGVLLFAFLSEARFGKEGSPLTVFCSFLVGITLSLFFLSFLLAVSSSLLVALAALASRGLRGSQK